MAQNILATSGVGYIGTHTVLQLLLGGYKAVVINNLDNSSVVANKQVWELAGKYGPNLTTEGGWKGVTQSCRHRRCMVLNSDRRRVLV
ncbi:hypothetical protein CsSME_00016159 [Camellia sinensis var. sinensis]